MKYILITVLIFISTQCFSQAKDTTKSDTLTIIPYNELQQIVFYIQQQQSGKVDVKNETWNEIIALLYKRTSIVPKPKK